MLINLRESLRKKFAKWGPLFRSQGLVILFVGFAILSIAKNLLPDKKNEKPDENAVTQVAGSSADTYIPEGFVLVPLELVNQSSIQSMIDQYALVDLYATKNTEKGEGDRHLLAAHLKMIRAPLNPDQFAVLVPDTEEPLIRKLTEPVFAVLKSPHAKFNKKELLKEDARQQKKFSRIHYGD